MQLRISKRIFEAMFSSILPCFEKLIPRDLASCNFTFVEGVFDTDGFRQSRDSDRDTLSIFSIALRLVLNTDRSPSTTRERIVKNHLTIYLAFVAVCYAIPSAQSQELVNLGTISLHSSSADGGYLQGKTFPAGDVHASNKNVNQEETWVLFEVDKAKHIYALMDFRTHLFLSQEPDGCVLADSPTLGPNQQWEFISGAKHNVPNAIAIRSCSDQCYLGANKAGQNADPCKGEVRANGKEGPEGANAIAAKGAWAGWWVMAPAATNPESGNDIITAVAKFAKFVGDQITPANVTALIALLAL